MYSVVMCREMVNGILLTPVKQSTSMRTSGSLYLTIQGIAYPITAVIDQCIYVLFNDQDINAVNQHGNTRSMQEFHPASGRWL